MATVVGRSGASRMVAAIAVNRCQRESFLNDPVSAAQCGADCDCGGIVDQKGRQQTITTDLR
jgi:hypothetical protein